MTTETKRDLAADLVTEPKRDLLHDLAICEAATVGPVDYFVSIDSEYEYEVCRKDYLDTIIASVITDQDARFIAEAFEGWPEAIRRAMAAEERVSELCYSNAYYIDAADRAKDDAYWTEQENVKLREALHGMLNAVERGALVKQKMSAALDHDIRRAKEALDYGGNGGETTQENNGR